MSKPGRGANAIKHGLSGSPTYRAWANVKQRHIRSLNKKTGPKPLLCDRWLDCSTFIVDVGLRPSPSLLLTRIDDSKLFEPGNVQWVERKDVPGRTKGNTPGCRPKAKAKEPVEKPKPVELPPRKLPFKEGTMVGWGMINA